MGLSMSQRRAVSRESAVRYRDADRPGKAKVLDELCAVTGWHRDHARKALRTALVPQVVRPEGAAVAVVRRAGDGGAAVLLGGAGRARRDAVGAGAGRVGGAAGADGRVDRR